MQTIKGQLKGFRTIVAMVVVAAQLALGASAIAAPATASASTGSQAPATAAIVLPDGMQIPDRLPKIQDLNLLTGWLWLWNTEAGRPIADYIRDNNVSVEYWNGAVNNSPVQPVTVNGRKQARTIGKIQISNRVAQMRMPAFLAGALAHEGYHVQLPFGPNLWPGSIYEEYQAYDLQQQVNQELFDRGWTGQDYIRIPLETNKFDKYTPASLAEYGRQLGPAYAQCKLYPWDK